MNTGIKRLPSNQLGSSLLEVMVSVMVLGIVAVGAISIGDQVSDQARTNRVSNNIFQLYQTIQSRTFMEQDCTAFLQNQNGGALTFDPGVAAEDGLNGNDGLRIGIFMPGARGLGEDLVSEAQPDMDLLGIRIQRLRLTNSVAINDGDPGPPQRYLAYVEVELGRMNALKRVVGDSPLFKKRIISALFIETSAANAVDAATIDSCRSASTDIDRQALCIGTDPDGDGVFTGGLGPKFVWDPVTEECIPPQEPLACPAGQVLTEIAGKTPVCIELGIEDQVCPSGQFVVQLGIGYLGCATPGTNVQTPTPGAPDPNCQAQLISWTVGTNTCSANVAFLSDGGTANVTDPAPDPQGSVTVTCNNGSLSQSGASCTGGGGPPGVVCCNPDDLNNSPHFSAICGSNPFEEPVGNSCLMGPGQYAALCNAGSCPAVTPPPAPACPPGQGGALQVSDTECPGDSCEVEVIATTGPLAGEDIVYVTDDINAAFYNNACAYFESELGVTTNTTANPCTTYTCPASPGTCTYGGVTWPVNTNAGGFSSPAQAIGTIRHCCEPGIHVERSPTFELCP